VAAELAPIWQLKEVFPDMKRPVAPQTLPIYALAIHLFKGTLLQVVPLCHNDDELSL
jgi:hypothetical protein